MLIKIKKKTLTYNKNYKFKCCIGRNGFTKNKIEGDFKTPVGIYSLGKLYYRLDYLKNIDTRLTKKKIKKNMGWCNDPKHKNYNKEIKINKTIKHEKLHRKDHKYDALIVVKYNTNPIISNKGSAIFIHLTKNYKTTAGCIALKIRDFLTLVKIIDKKTKIKIG